MIRTLLTATHKQYKRLRVWQATVRSQDYFTYFLMRRFTKPLRASVESAAKLLCPEKSIILTPVSSGSRASTPFLTQSIPSRFAKKNGWKWHRKGNFTRQMSFATAPIVINLSQTKPTSKHLDSLINITAPQSHWTLDGSKNRFFMLFVFILLATTFSIHAENLQFYSQYQQDRYVFETFFKDKKNGIFVDIGAYDGINFSNTYFFEKFMGWQGICIEPIPEVFAQLQSNRSCICIQGCIYDKSETVEFLRVRGYPEMLSGIISNYDERHLQRIQREVKSKGGSLEIIKVKCYPLTKLLLDHGFSHIDYLSIDTEGGEMRILQSIDFSQIDIDVIDIENNYGEPFQQFLEPHGYKKAPYHGSRGSPDEIYYKERS